MGCDHELNHNVDNDSLSHHGIKGMRWGIRRFQNKDGSLTPAGEKRAAKLAAKETRARLKDKQVVRRLTIEKAKQQMKEEAKDREVERKNSSRESKAKAAAEKAKAKQSEEDEEMYDLPDDSAESQRKREQGKKLLIGAVAVVGTVAAIYAFTKIKRHFDAKKAAGDAAKGIEDSVKEAAAKVDSKAALKKARAEAKAAAKATANANKAAAKAAKAVARADNREAKRFIREANARDKAIASRKAHITREIGKGNAERANREKMWQKMLNQRDRETHKTQQAAFKAARKATMDANRAKAGRDIVNKLIFGFVNSK